MAKWCPCVYALRTLCGHIYSSQRDKSPRKTPLYLVATIYGRPVYIAPNFLFTSLLRLIPPRKDTFRVWPPFIYSLLRQSLWLRPLPTQLARATIAPPPLQYFIWAARVSLTFFPTIAPNTHKQTSPPWSQPQSGTKQPANFFSPAPCGESQRQSRAP